jgi:hypothetical protein
VKKALLVFVGAVVAAILIIAIIPQEDCAGNKTWKTSETCQTGK